MNQAIKIADSILDLVGRIPLVRLNRIVEKDCAEILVKPEYLNPSGSIKDRIVKNMVRNAEENGLLKEGGTIVDASSGNTATALALIAAVKGYKFLAYIPDKIADPSRTALMKAYGCDTVTVETDAFEISHGMAPPLRGSAAHGGRIELAGRKLCLEEEAKRSDVWWARQFSNPHNTATHREETGPEILDQTDGKLNGFVASVGTGGTLLGIAQALKSHDNKIAIWGVEPEGMPMLAAPESYPIFPGISDGIVVDIMKSKIVDEVTAVTDEEAIEMAHRLATKEGLFCGISGGANVVAALRLGKQLGADKRVVTVLPDNRDRYLQFEKYIT